MYYFLLIALIWNSAFMLGTAQSSTANDSIPAHPLSEGNTTLTLNKTVTVVPANESSSTPSPQSESTPAPNGNITEESLPKNISVISTKNESHDNPKNGSALTPNPSKSEGKVITEGGSSVPILGDSVTNFQSPRENPGKVILTEGGDHGIIGDKLEKVNLTPNITRNSSSNDDSNKSQGIEGVSSMNKGKISARKGVNDPKIMNPLPLDDSTQVINTSLSTTSPKSIVKDKETLEKVNSSNSHERLAKPLVTDGSGETTLNRIAEADYIVPIVCTAFSVPLLIVLAVYLYKKGADFWERRHYNRMDFLIEGIYNE